MTALAPPDRPLTLTARERAALAKQRYAPGHLAQVAGLYDPFAAALDRHTLAGLAPRLQAAYRRAAFRFCARMMLDLDRTYWAFDWARILAWKAAVLAREAARSPSWKHGWETEWSRVTSTLFFLGVLPYSEAIHRTYHRELAVKWLGRARAEQLERQFVATALAIGYRHERMLRKNAVSVLLSVLVCAGKTDPAALTRADLEAWQARTGRSVRVARAGVTCIQRVLAAQGQLAGEAPRPQGGAPRDHFAWGRTAPAVVATFERFLADLRTVRAAATVHSYRVALRRFGDWLGEHAPTLRSIAEVRREHIEAFKQAVARMRCGDYTNLGAEFQTVNLGEPLSQCHRVRMLSCIRAFFTQIDALEYPERPGRTLWVRGDIGRVDETLPRAIPDADWRRLVATAERLTPEQAAAARLPRPFEQTRAILAVLLECGLRAGELCRLDTGCLVAARDADAGQETHWLRVPVGKLHNDRLIPVRPALVAAIDAWMRVRGPQPAGRDRRTGRPGDFLFTWQGRVLSGHRLNAAIGRLCALAGASRRYTSHQFRHTLAVLWRDRGMRIETISQLLGHTDLTMTMRYAAVMPPTLRREFEAAFAALDEDHRAAAQVRVVLSPEAHLAAHRQWRESLWVDLGIGFCGLTAYYPCATRLTCQGCPNFIADRERLPLLERQRANLIELRGLGHGVLPPARQEELADAVAALDRNIAAAGGRASDAPTHPAVMAPTGGDDAGTDPHP